MNNICYKFIVFVLITIASGCRTESKTQKTDPIIGDSGTPYQKIVQKAYEYKKTGHNGAALKKFEEARKYAQKGTIIYASLLDDKASVLIRTGQKKEAQKKYEKALEIMEKEKGNFDLKEGIKTRLEILKQMNKENIICKEPLEPDQDGINYFPDITKYQKALGTLTSQLADCKKGNTIEGIAMRMHITNKGELIHATSKGDFERTSVEKCVIERLEKLLPSLQKPKFSACFRGFSYTFMLGPHPEH